MANASTWTLRKVDGGTILVEVGADEGSGDSLLTRVRMEAAAALGCHHSELKAVCRPELDVVRTSPLLPDRAQALRDALAERGVVFQSGLFTGNREVGGTTSNHDAS